jgi:hypothetical protein
MSKLTLQSCTNTTSNAQSQNRSKKAGVARYASEQQVYRVEEQQISNDWYAVPCPTSTWIHAMNEADTTMTPPAQESRPFYAPCELLSILSACTERREHQPTKPRWGHEALRGYMQESRWTQDTSTSSLQHKASKRPQSWPKIFGLLCTNLDRCQNPIHKPPKKTTTTRRRHYEPENLFCGVLCFHLVLSQDACKEDRKFWVSFERVVW